ncbi:Gfo/Idh/MocA family oxidoreductase [Actinosynnema mirum]|uniref:Oxidoreductase domain protein n=1 Tax=Actinosynnema mirum (strain ATCC 29888 / DSM 43827 / JCM 3225 / NBRC 14064 / NCIMB 13271 / NRRL B-12336 / IMRU 3971 / 101) TaxID=446462 RepID=C6WIW9_ACTMD|nr:Gfo/Idh/MocA family oxidoreductase [Actinosynnema mirum]ACU40045.1 oxidoreductase domain protein [Actinosynnema mirum DSM 43827]
MRTALLGFGLGGTAFHAPFLSTVEGLTLSAVVTSRSGEVEGRYPGVEVLTSAEELWSRAADFDLVVVTTPNRLHAAHARAALERGLSVVVDKPFAATAEEARGLAALAEARGLLLAPFHNRRWDGDFRTAARLVRDGELGAVHRFESRFERWRPEVRPGWKESADPEALGSVVYDLGTHLVDQAVALFGRPRSVYAEVRALRAGAQAHDDAFLALTHGGGEVSHLWASALANDLGPRFRVLGSRSSFVKRGMDPQEAALRAGELPGGPTWGHDPGPATLGGAPVELERGAYQDFYAAVARRESPVPVEDAIAGLEVVEAAFESARTGRVVEL